MRSLTAGQQAYLILLFFGNESLLIKDERLPCFDFQICLACNKVVQFWTLAVCPWIVYLGADECQNIASSYNEMFLCVARATVTDSRR